MKKVLIPELRKNPFTGTWVSVAPEREKRPQDGSLDNKVCPFCEGNEAFTPSEIPEATYRNGSEPNTPGWWIRTVPNKFPGFMIEGELESKVKDGLYEKMEGVGAHDVIIETPLHDEVIETRRFGLVEELVRNYRDNILRLKEDPRKGLSGDPRFKHVLIFKNSGEAAGASLEHPHSQLIATPEVFTYISQECNLLSEYDEGNGNCLHCDVVKYELEKKVRVVYENNGFVSFVPFAPRNPYEMWIVPKNHNPDYSQISDDGEISLFAQIFQFSVKALVDCLGKPEEGYAPPYNFYIDTVPIRFEKGDNKKYKNFHWHAVILPRSTIHAGFEYATGGFILPLSPEKAAEQLKNALNN